MDKKAILIRCVETRTIEMSNPDTIRPNIWVHLNNDEIWVYGKI